MLHVLVPLFCSPYIKEKGFEGEFLAKYVLHETEARSFL